VTALEQALARWTQRRGTAYRNTRRRTHGRLGIARLHLCMIQKVSNTGTEMAMSSVSQSERAVSTSSEWQQPQTENQMGTNSRPRCDCALYHRNNTHIQRACRVAGDIARRCHPCLSGSVSALTTAFDDCHDSVIHMTALIHICRMTFIRVT